METIVGDYQITGTSIARGSFSDVFLGKHRYNNSKVAIKRIKVKNAHKLDKIVSREIEIHSKLRHPNIIRLYDTQINYTTNYVYLIMEYCSIGSLKDYQATHFFTEADIQNIMHQIVAGLRYLYDSGVLHRDLKPQNILLDEYRNIKLIDFGLAREFHDSHSDDGVSMFDTFCGSPMYMSPEMVHHRCYDTMSDIWSLGVIMFELITGHPPYHAKNFQQLEHKIMKPVVLPDKYYNKLSKECIDLLYRLLQNNSRNRICWDELFNHTWIISNLALKHENALIENPLAFDLLEIQKTIPKDNEDKPKPTNTSIERSKPLKPQQLDPIIGSGLIRNYSAGVLNGLSQTPPSLTPTKPPKLTISTKPTFFNDSISVDNSFPTTKTSSTRMSEEKKQYDHHQQLDTSIQEDFDNIIQEYNVIPTGFDSFESESSFALATTLPGMVETASQTSASNQKAFMPSRTSPIPIPRTNKSQSQSYDSDFIAIQRDLKFITPPDHTYNENGATSRGFSKFFTSSFRILKDSLRDSYDYLSSNPKSL
jgi:serine/threonine protein kinase